MPYGNGQRLGESIDPRLMQVDYSAYERAGATQGGMFAQMGADIGGGIKKYSDNEKTIKKAEQMAKSIRDAIPELADMGNNALTELNNPDLSQRDRLAIAEGIQDSLKLGVLGLDRKDAAWDRDFRERQFGTQAMLDRDRLNASLMGGESATIMSADELQAQIGSGAKVKYVPLGNGMYKVESATANEQPMFGNVMVGPDGQIQQAPSSGGSIRIPGAGSQIQNALPQTQGGSFPSGKNAAEMTDEEIQAMVANTPQLGGVAPNYGNFDQATQGVDVDGNAGVLPPRQQAAQQIQAAQNLVPNAPVPKGDVFTAEGGKLGVTRLEGSTPEIDYKLKEAELMQKQAQANQAKEVANKAQNAEVNDMADARFILNKSSKAKEMIQESLGDGTAGALLDMGRAKIPGTQEYVLENQVLSPIRNALALGNLKKMRENSPTGSSGMGSLTEKEGQRLESKSGTIKVGGDKNILLEDITNIQKDTLDTVHGTKEQRAKWLKEGKITPEQNDQVEAMYSQYGFTQPESTSSPIRVSNEFMEAYKKFRGK